MELRIMGDDCLRVVADHKKDNFIDVRAFGYEAMAIDLFPRFQYIEIRKKQDVVRVFTFLKKSYKKECVFGWWEDAEVILAINNVKHKD